jgi:uroporphyrinogen III methyltransferase/synthase
MTGKKGKVYLVGAGPGDTGLLTIKGLKCLRAAGVVVYDFHLNAQILSYAGPEAELVYAGKRGGRHTMEQAEINRILVDRAKKGLLVCRLKGGDPFVFGRGGEEAEALAASGIEFEIVPGVSSSVAAPAYAGIPLTHRKYSSSFAVIPGYEDLSKEGSSIKWKELATGVGTLVFLMAVKNIGALTDRLMENGRPAETPVAVIRWGTRPEQRTIVSTLSGIARAVMEKDITPPAVMVVGDVVKLRDALNWYEKKPLFGHRVLLTRADPDGFECLEDLGAEVMLFPTLEIQPPGSWDALEGCLKKIKTYDWLVFTSSNGVDFFFDRLSALGMDIRELAGLKICAVGKKTASEIEKFRLKVDLTPEEYRAEGLIKAFGADLKGLRFLLPRAEKAREVFPDKVRELGGEIDVPPAYRALKPEARGKRLKRFLKEGRITIAAFTSGGAFNNFVEIMAEDGPGLLRGVTIAAIGPVTAKAIERAGFNANVVAREATAVALARAIKDWIMLNNAIINKCSNPL